MVRGIHRGAGDRAEIVLGEVVSDGYFETLGVMPARGRTFRPEENRTELTHPVAVVSHGFWKGRLAGDPAVVGRTIELSGTAYDIVGVAPEGFAGTIPGITPEFWVPVMMTERLSFSGIQSDSPSPGRTRLEKRGSRWLFVTARLRPGRTLDEARAQIEHGVLYEIHQGQLRQAVRGDLRDRQRGKEEREGTRHATGLMDEDIDDRQEARAASPREQSGREEYQKCLFWPPQKEAREP
jgi:hypothetical protein